MSTRTATATIRATFESLIKNVLDASETGSPQISLGDKPSLQFATGTGANQCDRMWAQKARTVANGAAESLDIYDLGSVDIGAGAGNDGLGKSVVLAEICVLMIANASTSGGNLLIGGNGTGAAWNSIFASQTSGEDDAIVVLKPGGVLILAAPPDPAYAVADSTNHILKLDSSAGTCTFDIVILGRSA